MKRLYLTLMALYSFVFSWAYTNEINGIYYNLDHTTHTAQVTSGEIKYSGDLVIPSSVTYNSVSYSVTSIGDWAFSDCSGLTSVTIPNSVTSIGYSAFDDCTGLTSVTIPNSVTSIGGSAFSGCTGLTSIEIPNSVTSIGKVAFWNCSGLTSVTIPNSVTSIGNYAFTYCFRLTSVTIPNSVTSIGSYAFYGCSKLTSVTIPNSVTSIGESAFSCCRGLTSVTIEAETPPTLGDYAFDNTNYCPIYVPYGTIEAYKTAWAIYSSRITLSPSQECIYTISTTSANPEWGTTAGDTAALYLDEVEISAIPNYGYHFVRWDDNNTSNPRTVTITEDKTFTATFAKNVYSITANAEHGSISGNSSAEYLDQVTLSVSSDYGYHFTQWSDGNTDNPRTFVLTQDTTFTAEFAVDKSGTCGKNNLLQWTFVDDGTLTISGSGELTENYTFGVEAPMQMQQLVVGNEVTAIGERAFYEKTTLQKLIIGSNVTSIGKYAFASINNRQLTSLVMPAELLTIGDYAFSGNTYLESIDFNAKLQSIGAYAFKDCYRVSEMTCLATVTPNVGTDALTSINSYASLCVPAECLRKYQVDPNWGRFDLCELGTTSTVTENRTVTVEPTDNTAIFTWPTENNAASYSLQITKDGVVFCTLVFNSNGQLTGIAFAPGRNGAAHAPAATMSVAGMSFTVTGLNGASKYAYRLAVTNDASEELVAYSGEFATTGYTGEINPGGEPELNPTGTEDIQVATPSSKLLRNGQIYILRGDKVYSIDGQEVR